MQRSKTEANLSINNSLLSPDDIYNKSSSENIIPLLLCQICLHILISPVECDKCKQCYCQSCIKKYNYLCPYRCKNPNFKENKFINKVLSTLKFKCKNGCNKIIGYDNLEKHYDEDCDKIDFKKKYKDLKRSIELKEKIDKDMDKFVRDFIFEMHNEH